MGDQTGRPNGPAVSMTLEGFLKWYNSLTWEWHLNLRKRPAHRDLRCRSEFRFRWNAQRGQPALRGKLGGIGAVSEVEAG